MIRKLLLLAVAVGCVVVVGAQTSEKKKETKTPETYKFTDVKVNPVTSVKDQARSGTCWCFSGVGMIESDLLREGKGEIDLSEMWLVRNAYFDKVVKYVRMHGLTNLGPGGAVGDVPSLIDRFGLVPEEVYPGLNYGTDHHVHGELDDAVKAYADAIVKNSNKTLTTAWEKGLDAILDSYFGPKPEKFTYEGKEYTPESFARELGVKREDYVSLTSFTHHPFYAWFALEIPDNWMWEESFNVPLDDLMRVIDEALSNGYTVNWASDVSEDGFAFKKGVAVIPVTKVEELSGSEKAKWTKLTDEELADLKLDMSRVMPEKAIDQQMRQKAFDNYETTDDHGMLIVGTAEDQKGNKFYKVKNSWGTIGEYQGYFYASVPFVQYKTTGIIVPVKALPADIAARLGRK